MRKILSILLFLFSSLSYTYANSVETITVRNSSEIYENTKFSIPDTTEILSHDVTLYNGIIGGESIIISEKNTLINYITKKIGKIKFQNLINQDYIYIVGKDKRQELFGTGNVKIHAQDMTTLSHKITLDINKKKQDVVLKIFPIDPTIFKYYNNSFKAPLKYSGKNGFPKIFLFDDIILPQDVKGTYNYGAYVEAGEQKLIGKKKYYISQFKYYNTTHYAIVPYFEIALESSSSQINNGDGGTIKDRISLSYKIINSLHFTHTGGTKIKIISNSKEVPFIEYTRH